MIRIALVAALLAAPAAFADKYTIDAAHSSANFQIKHMMVSKVNGHFKTVSGTIDYNEKEPEKTSVEATIDATSIETGDAKRDGHLQSPDFFDTKAHPTIHFKSTSVKVEGPGKFSISGDLTLHGVTKPVVLEVEGFDNEVVGKRGATATTTINRKEFGVSWNKQLDKGGVALGEDVKVTLEIEANKAKE